MWYEKSGKDTDIVLYSRACIYRNIKGIPFPQKMVSSDREHVIDTVREAVKGSGMKFVRLDELDDKSKADLFDQYYATYAFLNDGGESAFLIDTENSTCVTVNRTEHIEIDTILAGSNIREVFNRSNKVAVDLEKKIDIAYTEKFGFLTSDLRLLGTGLQLVFLVALPGIEKTQAAYQMLSQRIAQYDWKIEPAIFAEETNQAGLYVIHNVATLGVEEASQLEMANRLINEVIFLERKCRSNIVRKKSLIVEDQYYRAYGLLRYARKLTTSEVMSLLLWLRLGLERIENDETDLDWYRLNRITHDARRDYGTMMMSGNNASQKAIRRAERVRKILKGDDEI